MLAAKRLPAVHELLAGRCSAKAVERPRTAHFLVRQALQLDAEVLRAAAGRHSALGAPDPEGRANHVEATVFEEGRWPHLPAEDLLR